MPNKIFHYLLQRQDLHPVLVDVGASGAPPEIWKDIAQESVYVGFDPDLREISEKKDNSFSKALIINEAVASNEVSNKVLFYFTKSPLCSSTLQPDQKSLSNFLFSELFFVERTAEVNSTTLDKVMKDLNLSRLDWLKLDTQGTDLRIFNSLEEGFCSRVLALDIEPGLIDAYQGEDLFVDAHRDLVKNGFWLSNLNVGGTAKIKKSTLNTIISENKNIN